MKSFFLFLLSLLLLIPTMGVSFVIWIYFKKKSDKQKVQLILNEVEKSSQSGNEFILLDSLKHVSMKMVKKRLKATDTAVEVNAFVGKIDHPTLNKVYLVMMKNKQGVYICMCNNKFDAQRKLFKISLQLRSSDDLALSKMS